MPTYEYACTSCGRHFEVRQRFTDAPLETCEVCSGKLKRVFHPVGIVLKGSGFYATDNRPGKSTSSKPASTETKSSDSTSTDSKSETKSSESKTSETKPSDTKSTPSKKEPSS
jgi:putative FmdB family regulatory protein